MSCAHGLSKSIVNAVRRLPQRRARQTDRERERDRDVVMVVVLMRLVREDLLRMAISDSTYSA